MGIWIYNLGYSKNQITPMNQKTYPIGAPWLCPLIFWECCNLVTFQECNFAFCNEFPKTPFEIILKNQYKAQKLINKNLFHFPSISHQSNRLNPNKIRQLSFTFSPSKNLILQKSKQNSKPSHP